MQSDRDDETGLPEDAPPSASRRRYPRYIDELALIQRSLAAVDVGALNAARRAIQQFQAIPMHDVGIALDAIPKSSDVKMAIEMREQWARSLSAATLISDLYDTIEQTAALGDVLERIHQGFKRSWRLDVTHRWLPSNLRSVPNLDLVDAAATVALDEGIPLSWIPRAEIVVALVQANEPQARLRILHERQDDILDDCEAALAPSRHEWSVECRSAIRVLRLGNVGPAQSHAANIVDSILRALDRPGRARERARHDFGDLPLQSVSEHLTLRPLVRALTEWWPGSGKVAPERFSRHATAHALGQRGVVTASFALVAVMLATSLTVQYAPGGLTETDAEPSSSH